ncbi:MAG: hypothetical protein ACJA2M_000570 [Polaribacter sp.]|jgi:hypothetical protein
MKKGVLILLGMFIMVSAIEAKNGERSLIRKVSVYYNYNNAVNFTESGIKFFIFTNGDFDFNSYVADSYYNYNGRKFHKNRAVKVNRDYSGRITRIGNAIINYDYRGNVTRIGSVFLRYRFGQLTNVGDLSVQYDRWGNPNFYGNVRDFYFENGIRFSINFGDVFDYNDTYFYRNDFKNNYTQFREDKNFYYYKARPKGKIGERSTILKRRKHASTISKRTPNTETKRRNTSYRKVAAKKRSNNTTYRKTSSINPKRTVTARKRKTTSSYIEPDTSKRKVKKTTKRKIVKKSKNERKRRN